MQLETHTMPPPLIQMFAMCVTQEIKVSERVVTVIVPALALVLVDAHVHVAVLALVRADVLVNAISSQRSQAVEEPDNNII